MIILYYIRCFFGGDGLTARYYDDLQITRDVDGLFAGFSGTETFKDNFWERGDFAFADKLTSSNLSLFGGIEWSGLYKPRTSGEFRFRFSAVYIHSNLII